MKYTFIEGIELKDGILVLLIFFVATGMAAADVYNDSIYSSNNNLTLTVEQSVKRRWVLH
jgi:hypothetical protein